MQKAQEIEKPAPAEKAMVQKLQDEAKIAAGADAVNKTKRKRAKVRTPVALLACCWREQYPILLIGSVVMRVVRVPTPCRSRRRRPRCLTGPRIVVARKPAPL